jgi:hypothetical protein
MRIREKQKKIATADHCSVFRRQETDEMSLFCNIEKCRIRMPGCRVCQDAGMRGQDPLDPDLNNILDKEALNYYAIICKHNIYNL